MEREEGEEGEEREEREEGEEGKGREEVKVVIKFRVVH